MQNIIALFLFVAFVFSLQAEEFDCSPETIAAVLTRCDELDAAVFSPETMTLPKPADGQTQDEATARKFIAVWIPVYDYIWREKYNGERIAEKEDAPRGLYLATEYRGFRYRTPFFRFWNEKTENIRVEALPDDLRVTFLLHRVMTLIEIQLLDEFPHELRMVIDDLSDEEKALFYHCIAEETPAVEETSGEAEAKIRESHRTHFERLASCWEELATSIKDIDSFDKETAHLIRRYFDFLFEWRLRVAGECASPETALAAIDETFDFARCHPAFLDETLLKSAIDANGGIYHLSKTGGDAVWERLEAFIAEIRAVANEKNADSPFVVTDKTLKRAERLEKQIRFAQLPGHAPALTGILTDGKPFDLAELKGKIICVEVSATWCGACAVFADELKPLYEKYHDAGLEVVMMFDEVPNAKPNTVTDYLAKRQYPWLILDKEKSLAAGAAWFPDVCGIVALPTILWINRDGNVVETQDNHDAKKIVERLMMEN